MFKVLFVNFDQKDNQEFQSVFDALDFAKDTGFECAIWNKDLIANYSPINGVTWRMSQLLTTSDAAFLLGLTVTRIHQFIREGRLKSTKFGKSYVINISDLEDFARIPRLSGKATK